MEDWGCDVSHGHLESENGVANTLSLSTTTAQAYEDISPASALNRQLSMEKSRRVKLRVLGKRDSYLKYTLTRWLEEVKDLLKEDLGVEVKVVEKDGDFEAPVLCVGDEVILVGLPGEEGYLLEALRRALRELGLTRRDDS